MSEENLKVVRSFVEAFQRGDLPGALEILADDSVVDEAAGMKHSGVFHGPAGFQQLINLLSADLDAEVASCDYLDTGEEIITKMTLKATSKATGKTMSQKVTELYTVKNGKIAFLDS